MIKAKKVLRDEEDKAQNLRLLLLAQLDSIDDDCADSRRKLHCGLLQHQLLLQHGQYAVSCYNTNYFYNTVSALWAATTPTTTTTRSVRCGLLQLNLQLEQKLVHCGVLQHLLSLQKRGVLRNGVLQHRLLQKYTVSKLWATKTPTYNQISIKTLWSTKIPAITKVSMLWATSETTLWQKVSQKKLPSGKFLYRRWKIPLLILEYLFPHSYGFYTA